MLSGDWNCTEWANISTEWNSLNCINVVNYWSVFELLQGYRFSHVVEAILTAPGFTYGYHWNSSQRAPWHLKSPADGPFAQFRRTSKKTPKLCVTSLCEGNPPVTDWFPSQRTSNAENVSIWRCHHGKRGVLTQKWPIVLQDEPDLL